jgi:hypothetical protein
MEAGDFGELSRAASPPPWRSRGSPSRPSEALSVGLTLPHQPGPCVPVKECAQQGCCACDHADRAAKQRISIRKREPVDRTVLIGPDERENPEAGKSQRQDKEANTGGDPLQAPLCFHRSRSHSSWFAGDEPVGLTPAGYLSKPY